MPELFTRFGGHRQAAGLSMAAESVPEFRRRLNAYASERLTPADFKPQLQLDAMVGLRELTTGPAVQELLAMAPFGFGNPPPMLAIVGAELAERAGGDEGETSARPFPPGRPEPFSESMELRRDEPPSSRRTRAWTRRFSIEEDTYSEDRGFANWAAILRDVRPST